MRDWTTPRPLLGFGENNGASRTLQSGGEMRHQGSHIA
jgi:hypothetical protein